MRRPGYTEALFLYDYYPVVGSPLEMWMLARGLWAQTVYVLSHKVERTASVQSTSRGASLWEKVGKTLRPRAGIAFSRGNSLSTSFRESERDGKMGHLWVL